MKKILLLGAIATLAACSKGGDHDDTVGVRMDTQQPPPALIPADTARQKPDSTAGVAAPTGTGSPAGVPAPRGDSMAKRP